MITKDEIIQIYDDREKRLVEWVESKPEKKTRLQLKKDLKKWQKEITQAQQFAKDNDPHFPPNNLGTTYTFMNVSSAIFANYVVAKHYIKKLEKESKKSCKKRTNSNSKKY